MRKNVLTARRTRKRTRIFDRGYIENAQPISFHPAIYAVRFRGKRHYLKNVSQLTGATKLLEIKGKSKQRILRHAIAHATFFNELAKIGALHPRTTFAVKIPQEGKIEIWGDMPELREYRPTEEEMRQVRRRIEAHFPGILLAGGDTHSRTSYGLDEKGVPRLSDLHSVGRPDFILNWFNTRVRK